MSRSYWRVGVSSSTGDVTPLALEVGVTDSELRMALSDGRRLAVPLSWFLRLQNASPAARQRWRLVGNGAGIHWPDADEHLGLAGLLAGRPGRTG